MPFLSVSNQEAASGKGEQNALQQMAQLGNFWNHAVVIFTNAGEYGDTDEEQNKGLDEDLAAAPAELKWLMKEVKNRRVVVEGRNKMEDGYYDKKLKQALSAVENVFCSCFIPA